MKQGYFYIANKTQNGKRIGLIFIINIGDGRLLKLSTLKYIAKDNSILVVFTPVLKNEANILKKHLKKNSIVQKTFDEQTCKFLGEIISGILRPDIGADPVIRELTAKQDKDDLGYRVSIRETDCGVWIETSRIGWCHSNRC